MDKITEFLGGKVPKRILIGFFYLSIFLVALTTFITNQQLKTIISTIVFFGYIVGAVYIFIRIFVKRWEKS